MLSDVLERLEALTAPDRTVDALVVLALMGHKPVKNPNLWVLNDKRSQPLCFMDKKPLDPKLVDRWAREGTECINFEYAGSWFHFVCRAVPPVTANIDTSIAFAQRCYPRYDCWQVDSSGAAFLWSKTILTIPRLFAKNNIAPAAVLSAILSHKIRTTNGQFSDHS
jgi:hypothetical protein